MRTKYQAAGNDPEIKRVREEITAQIILQKVNAMSLPQRDVRALSSVMKSATGDGSIATLIEIQRRNKLYLNSFVIPCEDQVDGLRTTVTGVEFCGSTSTHFFVSPICSYSIGYKCHLSESVFADAAKEGYMKTMKYKYKRACCM